MRRATHYGAAAICLTVLMPTPLIAGQTPPSKGPEGAHQGAAQAKATAGNEAGPSPEDRKRRGKALVKWKGGALQIGDLEDALAEMPPMVRRRYEDPSNLRGLLDRLVKTELMADEALELGLDKDPKVRHSVKQNTVQSFIREQFDERITPDSIPSEKVQAYYKQHENEFNRKASVRAAHIVLPDAKTARQVLTKARGADMREFRKLAREHSADQQTKLRGGDLKYFDQTGTVTGEKQPSVSLELVKAAFKLKKIGDVAKRPVQTESGWSVVKLTGRRPAESRSLKQVDSTIRLRLWREHRQQAIESYVADLRRQHPPKIHLERIQKIKLDAAPVRPGLPGMLPGQNQRLPDRPPAGRALPAKATPAKASRKAPEGQGPHRHPH